MIVDKMQQIVDAEAPIMYDRLVKKTLRAFHISRSSPQTLEATDRALKKVSVRMNKQAGVKFYWRKDQIRINTGFAEMKLIPATRELQTRFASRSLRMLSALRLRKRGLWIRIALLRVQSG